MVKQHVKCSCGYETTIKYNEGFWNWGFTTERERDEEEAKYRIKECPQCGKNVSKMTWEEKLKQAIMPAYVCRKCKNFNCEHNPRNLIEVNAIEIKDLDEILAEAEKEVDNLSDEYNEVDAPYLSTGFDGERRAYVKLREILKEAKK